MAKKKPVDLLQELSPMMLDRGEEALEALKTEPKVPSPASPEWTAWVLEQMSPREVVKGHPTVPGLRRVCLNVFGVPTQSMSRVAQAAHPANEYRACVEHTLSIDVYDQIPNLGNRTITVMGIADVAPLAGPENAILKGHPAACAETKAEGRAYVRAMRLDICSHEELGRSEAAKAANDDSPWATPSYFALFNSICCDLNLDALAVLTTSVDKPKSGEPVRSEKVQSAFRELAELNRQKNNKILDPKGVEYLEQKAGFKPDWWVETNDGKAVVA